MYTDRQSARASLLSRSLIFTALVCCTTPFLMGDINYELAPINYKTTAPNNAVTRLQQQVDQGGTALEYDQRFGYLPALLKALNVSTTTQVMPFGKLSRQNPKISPQTPRAIYFGDDIHIGYVQDGLIEIAVTDPLLGMVFYVLDQKQVERPMFENQSASCLTCHGTARTRNVPGLQIRSVIPDLKGEPVLAAGSYRTDHTSPIDKRWGGWYVTGNHGSVQHLGNLTLPDQKRPKQLVNVQGQNVHDLSHYFETGNYLTPHSDLVALMVLEHQADALNYITIANFQTRHALFQQCQQLALPEANADQIRLDTEKQIAKAGDALVRYLLFHGEAQLRSPLKGTSQFTEQFAQRGPFDAQGRSLREFDLQHRIFKYPLSYIIYSEAFDALPIEAKRYVYRKLHQLLTVPNPDPQFMNQGPETRLAMLQILSETKPDFETLTVE